MARTERENRAACALVAARFYATAAALSVGELPRMRPTITMLRWAVGHYRTERGVMAKALKCCKAVARERRAVSP